MRLSSVAAALAFGLGAVAKTVSLDFNVTWVMANPDGLAERKVIGINGAWPLPIIEVDKGDRLVVNMYNGLGDKSTSIHWHGMFQNGTNTMDGASMLTQCPIPPGSSMTYNFTIPQNGTYWYHCHTDYCYPDGYRQALIVHDADAPFAGQYDEEMVLTLSDWYHELLEDLSKEFMSLYNPSGAEPVPDSFLLNDRQNSTFAVEAGKTYLLRIVSIANFVAEYFYIEGLNMTIVEVDGVYTEPATASVLYVAVAQRYSVLVTIPAADAADAAASYRIVTVADQDLMDVVPSGLQLNHTNWLVADAAAVAATAPLTPAVMTVASPDDLEPFDDLALVPTDGLALLPEPDLRVTLTVAMVNLMTGYNYAMLNNITYTAPKVPSLYTALGAGDLRTRDLVYGEFTHPVVLGHNQVVEVVLNNDDSGTHPFHLHGHNFQVIDRAPAYGPLFTSYLDGDPVHYNDSDHAAFPAVPMRRDTVVLPPQGYVVLRFVADNPGVWFFHCHIDWHLASGLAAIFVEAPELIPERITVPDEHYDVCRAAQVPYVGNAAANTEDYADLSGQNRQPANIPDGWTSRGEVAMAFSVLSALLGIASLVYYGLVDLHQRPRDAAAAAAGGQSSSAEEVAGGAAKKG